MSNTMARQRSMTPNFATIGGEVELVGVTFGVICNCGVDCLGITEIEAELKFNEHWELEHA
jgi:hypothetical protein